MMMLMVTEKPLYRELSWHLVGGAWWSQTYFDCTVRGGFGSHVGSMGAHVIIELNSSLPFVQMENQGGGDKASPGTSKPQADAITPISLHCRLAQVRGLRL